MQSPGRRRPGDCDLKSAALKGVSVQKRFFIVLASFAGLALLARFASAADTEKPRVFEIDFNAPAGPAHPRIGFLAGLHDDTPDALVEPLHPTLFRIGHQFRGRISGGLPAAIARVQKLGATYKLAMSDLVQSHPKDWGVYEADVKKLVAQTGDAADSIIWEVANEPDESYKPIESYYELYAHAFAALRAVRPGAQICGPSFAFPSYEKYKRFLDYCRANRLECNDISWHYTGWDPAAPIHQKWQLEKMRSFITEYPELKIREIHCDEWGAGPDKPTADNPGRLQPGRAVVWFHYLQDVYQVDRACRANWGGADDYLGGIITRDSQTYPAYFAYRWYGSMSGMEQLKVEGNDQELSAIGCRSAPQSKPSANILVGSVAKRACPVLVEINNCPDELRRMQVSALAEGHLKFPSDGPRILENETDTAVWPPDGHLSIHILLEVRENEAYFIQLGELPSAH
jgi:hypothetical protein